MSVRKLCCFTILAMIVAFAMTGRLNRYAKEFDIAKPGTALSPEELPWYCREPGRSRWASAVRTKDEITPAVFVPVQSKDARDLGGGKLLVASRDLADPNFAKTVILLVHFDEQGVVGLILNRRTDIALSRALEGIGIQGAKDRSDRAYLGGPVDVPSIFALLQSPIKVDGADRIFSSVYLISTKTLFEQTLAARPEPQVFHVYMGYAGWTKDQLQQEVELGAWFIFPADTTAVFSSDPSSLWPQMIRKTEVKYAEDTCVAPALLPVHGLPQ